MFYERGDENRGLRLISDPSLISTLKSLLPVQEPKFLPLMYDMHTMARQQMVPACLYSLMFALDTGMIDKEEASRLKTLIKKYKGTNIYDSETQSSLKGWNYALLDKTERNEIADIATFNKPSNMYIESFQLFCFADYLKPGHHQKIIRD